MALDVSESYKLPLGARLCQAYFGFAMLLALVFGFLCSPHMFEYDISMVRVLLLMAVGTVTMWLMSQRARSARAVGAATALALGLFGMYLFLAMLYFFDIAALFGGW